jgi:hypothetical protein
MRGLVWQRADGLTGVCMGSGFAVLEADKERLGGDGV